MADSLKLSSPWQIFGKKVKAFFEYDPDISVDDIVDNDGKIVLNVHCNELKKLAALGHLLPRSKTFGNIEMIINVISDDPNSTKKALSILCEGNAAMRDVKEVEGTGLAPARTYVRLEPELIQFFADDLTSYDGYETVLVEDVAREVFEGVDPSISFCTARIGEN